MSKKIWNIVNTGCKAKSFVPNTVDVNSFVTSFKDNFVNSLVNNFAVKNLYSSLGSCKNIETIAFHIEEIEKSLSLLSNSSALDCNGFNSLHLKYACPFCNLLHFKIVIQ